MNIVIIGGSRIVLIGSTSGIRRDRGGTFTETRKKSSEEDRSLLETSDLGKSHRPDFPSVPTGSTGGSEYPTFTGRYLLGSRWTAFFLPKETH